MPDYWDQFQPAQDNYWDQFQPADSGNNDFWGQFKEEKPEEQSWLDWGVTTGLRTAFPVAGSILGGIGGAAFGGVGAVPGTMAGGALGGGLGEAAAQWYEGKGFNPAMIGVEAGLGAIPLMGGKMPGLGSSLKEVGAYALRGAGEGAFMGGVGSVPRSLATTGEYPSWQEIAGQTAGGAAFGGLTSGVLGTGNVVREHYTPRLQKIADVDYSDVKTGDLFGPDDMPINRSVADLPPIGGTSVFDNKPYVPPIEGTPSVARPSAPTDVTFSANQIDPNTYMTLTRQLGRPPSMAEIEAFQTPSTPDNVVPFTPRPTPPPDQQLDRFLQSVTGGQERMGRNQQEIDAWEETPDDAFRGGPVGVVPKTTFSDEEARRIVDRAFPPPAPEPQPATEYGQNILDQEALQWMRGQDRIIADYQARGGRLMGSDEPSFQRAKRPYEDLTPDVPKRYHVFDENDNLIHTTYDEREAQLMADMENGYVKDIERGDEPSFAKVVGGGLSIDVDNRRAGVNLTKDYTSPLPGIMARESIQNALDAVKDLSDGQVKVRIKSVSGDRPASIEVYDNGKGLDETGLAEKLVRLFASGKANEEGATGGKGIGSASYILGGQHFQIETVAVDSEDGKKYRIIAGGSPDQFYDTEKGSDWHKEEVDPDTPTGTKIKVALTEKQEAYEAKEMVSKIVEHSRDKGVKLTYDRYGSYGSPDDISQLVRDPTDEYSDIEEHTIPSSANDKTIGQFKFNDSDITVGVAPHNPREKRNHYEVHYLNNGMYQFSETKYTDEKTEGIPAHVVVNVKPQMDEQDDNYPFINTREDVKKDMRAHIDEFLAENITGPAVSRRKNRTQELYDSMPFINTPTKRKGVIFDPGMRLTPEETEQVVNSPVVQALITHWDQVIDSIIQSTGREKWADRLEGIGLVLDPNMHGVHIPNPATKKSTILINPFIRAEMGMSPADNAFDNTITAIHEAAHIGEETGSATDPVPMEMDLSDPRYAKFYQSYFAQIRDHGDVGWKNTGHGMGFVQRLGEVYAKFGPSNTFAAADLLQSTFGGREYSPEFQDLLHLYTTSRGRPETTEDLLSGTGVKQANTGDGGESQVPGNAGLLGDGAVGAKYGTAADPVALQKADAFKRISETTGDKRLKRASDEIYKQEAGKITLAFLKDYGLDELHRLATDETGAINIPSWKDIKHHAGWGQGRNSPAVQRAQHEWIEEIFALPKNVTTIGDMSFPFRQGLGLFNTPQFWKAAFKMFQGLTQANFDRIDADIRTLPAFQPGPIDPRTGLPGPSFAEQIGVNLFVQPSKTGNRAQGIASRWLETGGNIPYASAAYRHSPVGIWFRGSNRANITFLNHLRANRLQYLLNRAQDLSLSALRTGEARPNFLKQKFNQQEAENLDPYRNLQVAREIADAVNTFTGQAPLRTHALPFRWAEITQVERAARLLGKIFFSPGLMSSRIRTLNPNTYIMATPQVRRQYLLSALGTAMGWTTALGLMKMYFGDEVDIGTDITSPDYGKAVIGDYRVDPGASNQQFMVLAARLLGGGYTSSSTGKYHQYGEGFQARTRWDAVLDFTGNKLDPVWKLGFDLARASGYQPVPIKDRTMQLFVPIVAQDLYELSQKRPDLIPMSALSFFGMGTQIYDRGAAESKFIDPKNDWIFKGGFLGDIFTDSTGGQRQLGKRTLGTRTAPSRPLGTRR